MPLLSLAMQNAAQPHQIGAVTANRQFFQQLGQALGGAMFGVVLSTTLTVELQKNLTPIAQSLPPAAQMALDPGRFRNSSSSEAGGGQQLDLGAQIAAAAIAPIEQQRGLVQAALGNGDAAARAQLVSSPTTLPPIKEQLQASTGADAQALARANSALDAAEQQAQQTARGIGSRVTDAVRLSFANSITHIYFYALWLAVVALVVTTLWLPEIPLSKHSRIEAPVME
jgi:hypothetical protein